MVTTKYSISAANRITGKSRTTLLKHIKQGKLSCEIDEQNNKVIDQSELMRVYGADCDFSREEGAAKPAKREHSTPGQSLEQQLHSVQVQLDMLNTERERERSQFQQQVDHLQDALQRAQETANKAMLLLENRSGAGELETTVKAIESRIAEQEKKLAENRKAARSEAMSEIKSMPWWRVLIAN